MPNIFQINQNQVANYNNQYHNEAMFNSYETLLLMFAPFLLIGLFRFIHYMENDGDFSPYRVYLIVEILQEYIFGIGFPLFTTIRKKQMRKFLWREFKDLIGWWVCKHSIEIIQIGLNNNIPHPQVTSIPTMCNNNIYKMFKDYKILIW